VRALWISKYKRAINSRSESVNFSGLYCQLKAPHHSSNPSLRPGFQNKMICASPHEYQNHA
jgi:hypothetical protein